MAVLLCLGVAFSAAPSMVVGTAYAAGNGGERALTVTGDTLDDKKVYAVQMFDARATAGEGGDITFDNYELVESWLTFFTAAAESGGLGLTDQDKDGDVDTDDARVYLETLETDGDAVKSLADKAQAWVRNNASNFTVITSDDEDPAIADKETFTKLKPGYYLVYPEGGSTGNGTRGTDAMLVNVPTDANAEWNMKSTFPTVDKKVDTDNEGAGGATDNGSAQVGDTVTFTLTSAVPDMSDYTTFYFGFIDTLSNGLEFVKAGDTVAATDVSVTIGEKNITSGYTVNLSDNVLKIEFENLKTATAAEGTIATGDDIVVTYKARITKDATATDPATNEVKVEYSNDPTTGTKGESTPDVSKVFTYKIDVNKWASDIQDSINGNLAGAKFVLSNSTTLTDGESDKSVIKLVNTGDGTGNAYRVAKPDEDDAVTSFTTTATGDITISGLEAGTYYLHEIEAPAGYNQLKAPIAIVITMTNAETGDATITVDGKGNDANSTVINVENKKGIELPTTGGMGTIGLTVLGVIIVAAGAIWIIRRNRKGNQR